MFGNAEETVKEIIIAVNTQFKLKFNMKYQILVSLMENQKTGIQIFTLL